MIFFERLYNLCVHISELATVALVKDNHAMLVKHFMSFVLGHKVIQLLNGCDDDFILMVAAFFVTVLKLSLQYSGRSIAVGRNLSQSGHILSWFDSQGLFYQPQTELCPHKEVPMQAVRS